MKKSLIALAAMAAAGMMATRGREESNLYLIKQNDPAGGLSISSESLDGGGTTGTSTADQVSARKSGFGFGGMTPERQREIASMGGKTAHARGTAHEFTSTTAREAAIKRNKNRTKQNGASATT